jgi:hypothetical protein
VFHPTRKVKLLTITGNVELQKRGIKMSGAGTNNLKENHQVEWSDKTLSALRDPGHHRRLRMTIPKSKMNKQRDLSRYSIQSNEISYLPYPNYDPVSLNRIPEKPKTAKASNRARSLNLKFKFKRNYRKSASTKPFSNTRTLKFSPDVKLKHIRIKK